MDYLGEENYIPNPVLEKALDVLFLLHADHELNASATTVLQTGSSLVDPYSAIASVVQNSSTSILHDLISYLVLAALLSSKHGLTLSKNSQTESLSLSGPLHGM
jgi:hypothetical protein